MYIYLCKKIITAYVIKILFVCLLKSYNNGSGFQIKKTEFSKPRQINRIHVTPIIINTIIT